MAVINSNYASSSRYVDRARTPIAAKTKAASRTPTYYSLFKVTKHGR
jgi:hypothetical protein